MRELKLFLGPQHPGMHGNASVHMYVEGDIIKKSYLLPGMLHRGFEKGMERHSWVNNISLIPRVCVVEPDINEMAFAMAVEKLAKLEVPERAHWIRMIILELARISIHLMAYGGLGSPTGNYTIMYHAHADRNRILDIFEKITGHRVYHQYIVPGGVRKDLPVGIEQDIHDFLDDLESRYTEYRDIGIENPTILKRISDTIMLPEEVVWELGVTGVGMRSAVNKPYDLRKVQPYARYDQVEFDVPVSGYSDARSRVNIKLIELTQSIRIIRQCLEKMPNGDVRVPIAKGQSMRWTVPKGHAYACVESSRGEFGYYMVSNGGTHPYRVGVRGASYPQGLLGIEKYLPGTRIDDAALWVDTMGVCSPEIDR
ncbi:NADH-quinone oxidoreductase subunit D [Candidatus Xianfuyuplasma coldseepsis]|uniref:NADH-quinone oxidoreductase subunit D n=1 Tax=Candidatus Xianfuyuplasma coldseepsis TaxID=2782163 RepID=A0A7L7KW19_9MOLU|nr:NADH-quinone oxidoreductase subunit D [Xianfuyuplasma coldseepsis]QMS85948.1 NADH-quinone oxidoreductase subunit D [Xianfuyuplasma coldseepsis]